MFARVRWWSGFKKNLDYRFVYLKQEQNNRYRDLFKRQDEKIGIANDVNKRRSQIKKTMRGRGLKTLFAIPIFYAETYEKKLHQMFSHLQKKKRGVSGGTEFFSLNFFQRMYVRIYLIFIFLKQILKILLVLGLLILYFTKYLK